MNRTLDATTDLGDLYEQLDELVQAKAVFTKSQQ